MKATSDKNAGKKVSERLAPIVSRVRETAGPLLKRAGAVTVRLLKRGGAAAVRLLKAAGRWLKENFVVKGPEALGIVFDGLLRRNPVLVLLLGLCPALAVTTSLQNGLAMGLTTTAVLICSSLVISLLRQVIPGEIRMICHVVIIAAFATAADLLLRAFLPGLAAPLGLYLPLMAASCLILGRAEDFACRNKPGSALLDGLCMGLGFTCALALLGAIREVLGAGAIWGVPVPVLSEYPVGLILSPCGGFIILGFLAAFAQFLGRLGKGGRKA